MAVPSVAHAQETAEQRGQRLFEEGRSLMDAGRAREACPKFAESDRLDPGGGTVMNLAVCYEETGRFVAARAAFQDGLERSLRQHRKDREDIAREHLAAIEKRVATIVIVGRTSARARVDGVWIDAEPGGRIFVDPGAHVVEVVPSRAQTISLREGEIRTFDADGAPLSERRAEAARSPSGDSKSGPSTSYTVSYNAAPFIALAIAVVGYGVASYGLVRVMRDDDGNDDSGKWLAIGGGVAAIGGTLGALIIPFRSVKPRTDVALTGLRVTF
jgi:hypothetical protein